MENQSDLKSGSMFNSDKTIGSSKGSIVAEKSSLNSSSEIQNERVKTVTLQETEEVFLLPSNDQSSSENRNASNYQRTNNPRTQYGSVLEQES